MSKESAIDTIARNIYGVSRSEEGLTGLSKARQYAEHFLGTDITPEKVRKLSKKLDSNKKYKNLTKKEKEKVLRVMVGKSMMIKAGVVGGGLKTAAMYGGYKAISGSGDE